MESILLKIKNYWSSFFRFQNSFGVIYILLLRSQKDKSSHSALKIILGNNCVWECMYMYVCMYVDMQLGVAHLLDLLTRPLQATNYIANFCPAEMPKNAYLMFLCGETVTVCDACPTLNQHWINVSCLLGSSWCKSGMSCCITLMTYSPPPPRGGFV